MEPLDKIALTLELESKEIGSEKKEFLRAKFYAQIRDLQVSFPKVKLENLPLILKLHFGISRATKLSSDRIDYLIQIYGNQISKKELNSVINTPNYTSLLSVFSDNYGFLLRKYFDLVGSTFHEYDETLEDIATEFTKIVEERDYFLFTPFKVVNEKSPLYFEVLAFYGDEFILNESRFWERITPKRRKLMGLDKGRKPILECVETALKAELYLFKAEMKKYSNLSEAKAQADYYAKSLLEKIKENKVLNEILFVDEGIDIHGEELISDYKKAYRKNNGGTNINDEYLPLSDPIEEEIEILYEREYLKILTTFINSIISFYSTKFRSQSDVIRTLNNVRKTIPIKINHVGMNAICLLYILWCNALNNSMTKNHSRVAFLAIYTGNEESTVCGNEIPKIVCDCLKEIIHPITKAKPVKTDTLKKYWNKPHFSLNFYAKTAKEVDIALHKFDDRVKQLEYAIAYIKQYIKNSITDTAKFNEAQAQLIKLNREFEVFKEKKIDYQLFKGLD